MGIEVHSNIQCRKCHRKAAFKKCAFPKTIYKKRGFKKAFFKKITFETSTLEPTSVLTSDMKIPKLAISLILLTIVFGCYGAYLDWIKYHNEDLWFVQIATIIHAIPDLYYVYASYNGLSFTDGNVPVGYVIKCMSQFFFSMVQPIQSMNDGTSMVRLYCNFNICILASCATQRKK